MDILIEIFVIVVALICCWYVLKEDKPAVKEARSEPNNEFIKDDSNKQDTAYANLVKSEMFCTEQDIEQMMLKEMYFLVGLDKYALYIDGDSESHFIIDQYLKKEFDGIVDYNTEERGAKKGELDNAGNTILFYDNTNHLLAFNKAKEIRALFEGYVISEKHNCPLIVNHILGKLGYVFDGKFYEVNKWQFTQEGRAYPNNYDKIKPFSRFVQSMYKQHD